MRWPVTRPGFKSVTFRVEGANAYGFVQGRARCPPAGAHLAL